jgi:uncharacterized protein (TIGR01777 family)
MHKGKGRLRYIQWDGKKPGNWQEILEGAFAVINLCGKRVSCRFTPANRKEILDSRISPTRILGEAISTCKTPPGTWINLGSAGIYGYPHIPDTTLNEDSAEGTGFLAEVSRNWEAAFFTGTLPETRRIYLRAGTVLGQNKGILRLYRSLAYAGFGGRMGSGNQFISWLHEKDLGSIMIWLLRNVDLKGMYNCCAPEAIRNDQFMRALRSVYGIPFGFPLWAGQIKIGARIAGFEPELLLKGRRVNPQRLLSEGFRFQFEQIVPALKDLRHSGK